MSKAIVGRPVDGITINGELEFLLDDSGEVKVLDSPEQARSFLLASLQPWMMSPVRLQTQGKIHNGKLRARLFWKE